MSTGFVESVECGWPDEEASGLIHSFAEGLFGLNDSSCFASFSKLFVADFSIPRLVRFLEVDVGSRRPINRAQFGIDGDEDGQMIAVQ